MEIVQKYVAVGEAEEFTVEMNPGTVDREKLLLLQQAGVNRLSVGVQSFDDNCLQKIGRIHTAQEAADTIELAHNLGFCNISLDLIYGLPQQDMEILTKSLERSLTLPVQHISIYGLQLEEGTAFQRMADMGKLQLPADELVEAMYDYIVEKLPEAGYQRYEISNYAKAGKECVHNKVYWQRGNYLGLGIGSASLIQNVRFHNVTDISSYVNLVLGENSIGNEIENASKEHGEKFQAEKDCLKKSNDEKECLKKSNAGKNDLKKENAEKEQVEKLTAEKEQVEKVNTEIENVKKDNIEKNSAEEGNTEKNDMESGNAACPDKNMIGRVKKLREEVQELPIEEQMEEFMFLGLRMMEGVSERIFFENFGRRFEEVFPGVIEKHEKLGLLEVTGEDAGKIEIKEEPDLNEKCQEEQQGELQEKEECQKEQQGKLQESEECQKEQQEEIQEMQMPGKKEIKKQEGKPQQEEQREEKQEGKLQQEEQRKEKQEGKLQQEERGREFVRLRLTPHGIDVSNQVFVDFML